MSQFTGLRLTSLPHNAGAHARPPAAPAPAVRARSPISGLAPLSMATSAVDRAARPPDPAPQPALLINPEELFDLQQQAEFFVSVGEHLQAIGHPILGDALYAPPDVAALAPRLLLHASVLGFTHPVSGVAMEFSLPALASA